MLEVVPCTFDEAQAFVRQHHRTHGKVVGAKFCVAIADDDKVRGVAIVGRPVARGFDDGWTVEITRCCTDGVHNGCSKLYGACCRVARALGYRRLVTYTLDGESGASLRASNWKCVGLTQGGSWNCRSRPRVDKHPTQRKFRWMMEF